MPKIYEIRVKGHIDPRWSEWFSDLEITALDGNETLLSGALADQAALHGLLNRIRDLNLTLISVHCNPPTHPQDSKGDNHEEN